MYEDSPVTNKLTTFRCCAGANFLQKSIVPSLYKTKCSNRTNILLLLVRSTCAIRYAELVSSVYCREYSSSKNLAIVPKKGTVDHHHGEARKNVAFASIDHYYRRTKQERKRNAEKFSGSIMDVADTAARDASERTGQNTDSIARSVERSSTTRRDAARKPCTES